MKRHIGKCLVLVLALGLITAGTAGAAKLITGKNVKNGSLTGTDIKNGSIRAKDVGKGSLSADRLTSAARASLRGQTGSQGIPGTQGAQGAQGIAGTQGAQGAQGVQGPSGTADRFALVGASGAVQEALSNDVATANVTHPATGIYCFDFPDGAVPDIATANSSSLDVIASVLSGTVVVIPGCPGADWRIATYDTGANAPADAPFWVLFDSK